jgi:hypothetical protein
MAKAAWLLAVVWTCGAQQPQRPVARPIPVTSPVPAGTISAAARTVLLQLTSHAGVIFSGQVLSIDRGGGFVDVRFRVDETVRGVAANAGKSSNYVLREWSGLWSGQPERYRVGQRLLMVLAPRGPSGMSAPVGGLDGAIPLLASGTAPLADAAGVAPVDTGLAEPPLAVDLRWIEARAARAPISGRALAFGATGPLRTVGSVAAPPPALSSVLALLRGAGVNASSEVRNARY